MNLQDRVALVTGGGRNLGRAIALRLAEEGAKVAIAAPDQEELIGVAAEIQSRGGACLPQVTDIRQEEHVKTLVAKVVAVYGRLDILVNNAGIMGPTCLVSQVKLSEWDEVMAINLTGAFLCCREAVPHMIDQKGGKIINISSIAGTQAYSLRTPYVASKWGLVGLSKTLAKELGPFNILVNAICPGPLAGERIQRVIQQRAAELGKSVEEVTHIYLQTSSLGRMTKMEDVAAMVAYLAGPMGDNITGQALEVAAGYGL